MTDKAPRASNQLQYSHNKFDVGRKMSDIFQKKWEVNPNNNTNDKEIPLISDAPADVPRGSIVDEASLLNDYYSYLHRNRYDQQIDRRSSFLKRILAWILLFVSVVGGASIGPFFLYVNTKSQLLKSAWRLWITSILLLPFVLWEYKRDREKAAFNKKVLFKPAVIRSLVLASLANSIWVGFLVYAINYTSMAQAYLFNNCQSFIIVFYKYFTRQKVSQYEFIGTAIAGIGAIFVASDNDHYIMNDTAAPESWWDRGYGDLLAFIGSIGAAAFFLINAEIKHKYPLYTGIIMMSIMGSIFMSAFSLIFEEAQFSFDEYHGIFGLFTDKWIGTYILIGIVTGLGCYVLYVVVSKMLDSLIQTVSLNFEPIFSALIVWYFGMQELPGVLTFIGAMFIIPGMICVVLGQHELKKQEGYYSVEMNKMSMASQL
jgi:drug/metabolite transporter (DMT)-like permease